MAFAFIILRGIQAALRAKSLRWSIRLFFALWRTSRSCSWRSAAKPYNPLGFALSKVQSNKIYLPSIRDGG